MITHFHTTNLMSDSDWNSILSIKDTLICGDEKMIVIKEDGSIIKDNGEINPCLGSIENPVILKDGNKGKPVVRNLQLTLEGYIPYFPPIIMKLIESIKQVLVDKGIQNPKPYSVRTYRNNHKVAWHRHKWPKNMLFKNGFITLYYLHPNWNTKNGGALKIGLIENEPVAIYDCLSNSLIGHSGSYGHGTDWFRSGYEGDRDVFVVNWLVS